MLFKHRENIHAFLREIKEIRVRDIDRSETNDLYEGKNITQVFQCLESLDRVSQNIQAYSGPFFGTKLTKENMRDHS
jgi:hypothetical protein